jgi:hypothetical protein
MIPNFNSHIVEQEQNQQHQQQVVQQPDDNPFKSVMQQMKLSDNPVQFGNSLAESLINDNEVPKETRKKWWHFLHKDNVLTFLDVERKRLKLLSADIVKIDMLNRMAYYDYTFDEELEFNIMRNVLDTKLDRALGATTPNVKNERTTLQSQFTENINRNEDGNNSPIKEGFFKRLLGRR